MQATAWPPRGLRSSLHIRTSIGNGAGAHDGQSLASLVAQMLALVDGFRGEPREPKKLG